MKSDNLKFFKIREVKSPTRAHSDDAGIDFYIPTNLTFEIMEPKFQTTGCQVAINRDTNGFIKKFILRSGESVLIPSGIKVNIPDGFALIFNNKSGVAAKKKLLVGSSVVDQSYKGEVHINLHNVSDKTIEIEAGDKIVQGIVFPINYCDVEETNSEEELYRGKNDTGRGAGGFGSTGDK